MDGPKSSEDGPMNDNTCGVECCNEGEEEEAEGEREGVGGDRNKVPQRGHLMRARRISCRV